MIFVKINKIFDIHALIHENNICIRLYNILAITRVGYTIIKISPVGVGQVTVCLWYNITL